MAEERRNAIDPTVAELMGDLTPRFKETARKQPPPAAGRKKQPKKRDERTRIQKRATYDLPAGMKDAVAKIAEELGTTSSQVAAALLADGLAHYAAGHIDLASRRTRSRSPMNEWNLDLTDLWPDGE